MDYTVSDSDLELCDGYRRLFEKNCTLEKVREAEPLGFDEGLWRRMLEMGAVSMVVSPIEGEADAGLVQSALVAEVAGRCLAPVPLVEATVAARVVKDQASSVPPVWMDNLMAGSPLLTFALRPVVDDVSRLAPSGAVAGAMVALATEGLVLCSVDAPQPSPHNLGTAPIADCRVGATTVVLAAGESARIAHARAIRDWKVLTASALVGLAEGAFQIALDYVKIRKAFGVLIGSFQTVQHRLADHRVALDGATFLCRKAAWAIDTDREDAQILANMAFLYASEVAEQVATDSLHFHGGIGYTMECDIQMFFRRAKAWPLVLGDPQSVMTELAGQLYRPVEAAR
jgi:alkylation response protein AidB-like acyl-CoA dehydrogenase